VDYSGFSSFYVATPSSSARSGGAISNTGCMVPQSFIVGGNRSYPDLWAVIDDSQYSGTRPRQNTNIIQHTLKR
jgi:hypothetical protein